MIRGCCSGVAMSSSAKSLRIASMGLPMRLVIDSKSKPAPEISIIGDIDA